MENDLYDINKLENVLKAEDDEKQLFFNQNLMTYLTDSEDDLSDEERSFKTNIPIDITEGEFVDFSPKIQSTREYSSLNSIKPYLSSEEYQAIVSCPNPELQKVMILNRSKVLQLKNLQLRYSNLLQKCYRLKFEEVEKQADLSKGNKITKVPGIRLGYPYFREKRSYTCPPNPDMILKSKRNHLIFDYSYLQSRWTQDKQLSLKSSICLYYRTYKQKKIYECISKLRARLTECGDDDSIKSIMHEIEKNQQDLKVLEDEDEIPPLSFDEIDWDQIADNLNGRCSAVSCKAFWTLYLHPDLNKNEFDEQENLKLIELSIKYNRQNWDAIATELGGNRSGYTVCIQFFAKLSEKCNSGPFSEHEDNLLLKYVNEFKIGTYVPWVKVAYKMQSRTKRACYHRWKYFLSENEKTVIKGRFSQSEDVLLLCLLKALGRKYSQFTKHLPSRTEIQIRHRCQNYLEKSDLNLGNYTLEEDKIIVENATGKNFKSWGALTKLLPKRNRFHIKMRYEVLSKWLAKNPGKPLSEMPRKVIPRWNKERKTIELTKRIAQEFEKEIPTLEQVDNFVNKKESFQTRIKRGDWVQQDVVDIDLVNFFKSKCKVKQTNRNITNETLISDTDTIRALLNLLKANIEIPEYVELESNRDLDDKDIFILTRLKEDLVSRPSCSGMQRVVPPNISTLVGLRSMLIRHTHYKQLAGNSKAANRARWRMEKSLVDSSGGTICNIRQERDLFEYRMYALFKWACVLSLNQPSDIIKKCILSKMDYEAPRIKSYQVKKKRFNDQQMRIKPGSELSEVNVIKKRKRIDYSNVSKRESVRQLDKKQKTEQPKPKGLTNLVSKDPNMQITVARINKLPETTVSPNPSQLIKIDKLPQLIDQQKNQTQKLPCKTIIIPSKTVPEPMKISHLKPELIEFPSLPGKEPHKTINIPPMSVPEPMKITNVKRKIIEFPSLPAKVIKLNIPNKLNDQQTNQAKAKICNPNFKPVDTTKTAADKIVPSISIQKLIKNINQGLKRQSNILVFNDSASKHTVKVINGPSGSSKTQNNVCSKIILNKVTAAPPKPLKAVILKQVIIPKNYVSSLAVEPNVLINSSNSSDVHLPPKSLEDPSNSRQDIAEVIVKSEIAASNFMPEEINSDMTNSIEIQSLNCSSGSIGSNMDDHCYVLPQEEPTENGSQIDETEINAMKTEVDMLDTILKLEATKNLLN